MIHAKPYVVNDKGLNNSQFFTIDLTTGAGKSEIESNIQVEGLTLTKELEQTIFYGSVGKELWLYDMEAEKIEILCKNLLGETEALEMMPDGFLLWG